ncbi:podocalyxin isoform X2 [Solea solea]|uniref:podocalyxin isoform X2 n=1 Tax=Solea solea TaxID=90069 RepID=UPI00272B5E12|nr:podocalyxin isoform X2 [Solea solea]
MRIAWLLLSLSSLVHCSDSTSESPSTTEDGPWTTANTTAVTNATVVTPNYVPTQPQSSLTNNPSSTHENNNIAPTFTTPTATILATTAATAPTLITATTNGSDNLLQTEVSPYATVGQQPTTHPTTASEISKGEKTTMPVTSNGRGTSGATQPAGKPETTTIPPTLTTRGSLASETTNTSGTTSQQTTTSMAITTEHQQKRFEYSLNNKLETDKDKVLVEVCRQLMANLEDGNCTLIWKHQNGKVQFESVEINGKVKPSLATQYYEEFSKRPADNKTLIAILASCGALLIMIVILAVCASHHRRPYNENQQHLTEELHTVENGYHDNPTLEVMEVQPEMQEKKVALNGEFSDSWIVPIDNLIKEDIPDEEDTHL